MHTCYLLLGETVSCNFESGDVCGWKNENFTVSKFRSNLEQSGPKKAFEGGLYDNSFVTDFVLWITIRHMHELVSTKKTQSLARCIKSVLGNLNKHFTLD